MADWRQLRHDRGIREFHSDITADNFMNPPDRVALFESFKKDQKVRHEERCQILKKLGDLRNNTLASELVNDVRQEFNKMNKVGIILHQFQKNSIGTTNFKSVPFRHPKSSFICLNF